MPKRRASCSTLSLQSHMMVNEKVDSHQISYVLKSSNRTNGHKATLQAGPDTDSIGRSKSHRPTLYVPTHKCDAHQSQIRETETLFLPYLDPKTDFPFRLDLAIHVLILTVSRSILQRKQRLTTSQSTPYFPHFTIFTTTASSVTILPTIHVHSVKIVNAAMLVAAFLVDL